MPILSLETNLAELPWEKTTKLCHQLNIDQKWKLLFDENTVAFQFRSEEIDFFNQQSNPSENLLRELGNRGVLVKDFLVHLHQLSRIHGAVINQSQCILGRKFAPVRFTKALSINEGDKIELKFKADGFPYPRFQWLKDDSNIEGEVSNVLKLPRCSCIEFVPIRCRINNEIEDGFDWSHHYRRKGKLYHSEMFTETIQFSKDYPNNVCDQCKRLDLARIFELKSSSSVNTAKYPDNESRLVATDKVALIISNSEYRHLPSLLSPPCDAESLAHVLLELDFKTVTLADLTLYEMTTIIEKFKLLGAGVYAVFYFVGHGFEVNGRCYMLPIDSPGFDYRPSDCLPVDWVISKMQEYQPALNVILLDICRRYTPSNTHDFMVQNEHFGMNIFRNTVVGYATCYCIWFMFISVYFSSCGEDAYEVKGAYNGIFMKYLKKNLRLHLPILDVLNRVIRDLEGDANAGQVQFPELRTNLSKFGRSLVDPIISTDHTVSFDHHTLEWQKMHELPDPVHVLFEKEKLKVTIWFDFCGHFTNMVYVFSSVSECKIDDQNTDQQCSPFALSYLAHLKFPSYFGVVNTTTCSDYHEGESVRKLLKNLQKSQGAVKCTIELRLKNTDCIVAISDIVLGHVLITRLQTLSCAQKL